MYNFFFFFECEGGIFILSVIENLVGESWKGERYTNVICIIIMMVTMKKDLNLMEVYFRVQMNPKSHS